MVDWSFSSHSTKVDWSFLSQSTIFLTIALSTFAPLCWPDYVHAVTPTNLVGGLKIQANPIIRHQPSS